MKILVNTDERYRDSIIRSRLADLGHDPVQVIGNDFERTAGSHDVGIYINECERNLKLLQKIRTSDSNIEPFVPVTVFSNEPDVFLRGTIGASAILENSFSVKNVDETLETMLCPNKDFIFIPEVYIGPDRRSQARVRPFDRRNGPHDRELRFMPKIKNNILPEWVETLSGKQLQETLLSFKTELRQTEDRTKVITRLVETLRNWNFSKARIIEVTGIGA